MAAVKGLDRRWIALTSGRRQSAGLLRLDCAGTHAADRFFCRSSYSFYGQHSSSPQLYQSIYFADIFLQYINVDSQILQTDTNLTFSPEGTDTTTLEENRMSPRPQMLAPVCPSGPSRCLESPLDGMLLLAGLYGCCFWSGGEWGKTRFILIFQR